MTIQKYTGFKNRGNIYKATSQLFSKRIVAGTARIKNKERELYPHEKNP
jgi:hypothetical protein